MENQNNSTKNVEQVKSFKEEWAGLTREQKSEKMSMYCFCLASVLAVAAPCTLPLHEPTSLSLFGMCALSMMAGTGIGVYEMGREGVRLAKAYVHNRNQQSR